MICGTPTFLLLPPSVLIRRKPPPVPSHSRLEKLQRICMISRTAFWLTDSLLIHQQPWPQATIPCGTVRSVRESRPLLALSSIDAASRFHRAHVELESRIPTIGQRHPGSRQWACALCPHTERGWRPNMEGVGFRRSGKRCD